MGRSHQALGLELLATGLLVIGRGGMERSHQALRLELLTTGLLVVAAQRTRSLQLLEVLGGLLEHVGRGEGVGVGGSPSFPLPRVSYLLGVYSCCKLGGAVLVIGATQ